jgi:glycerol-3-phosphate acyltransferase PlsY
VFGLLAPRATLAALIVFVVIVWVSRYVSLGSLAGAATLVGGTYGFDEPAVIVAAAAVAAGVIAVHHRENIVRLWRGAEARLGGA